MESPLISLGGVLARCDIRTPATRKHATERWNKGGETKQAGKQLPAVYLVRDGLSAPTAPVRRESRPVRAPLVQGDLGVCGAVRAHEGVAVLRIASHCQEMSSTLAQLK